MANSLLEEYVWRWFAVGQCARLMRPAAAVGVGAAAFALHHVLALQVYLSWPLALLCAGGVFAGGVLWGGMFLRYRSVGPVWLSHGLVDAAVFGSGYVLLFG